MIRVVICDGDGAVALDRPNLAQEIVKGLEERGIELAVATNSKNKREIERRFEQAGLTPPHIIVTKRDIGKAKPKPEFVYEVARQTGVGLNEIAFLGDDDDTDIFCAINAGVLPLTATYSTADEPRNYGLKMGSPENLLRFLSLYGGQEAPYFGWTYSGICRDTNTDIDVRALLGHHSWAPEIESMLKHGQDVKLGLSRTALQGILFYYLATRIYQSGLARDVKIVAVYPGHEQGAYNSLLSAYGDSLKHVFRQKYLPTLIERHTTAPKSQFQGERRNIFDQFSTIRINPAAKRRIKGKHVLVLDDFTTRGYSLETARRMLLNAGASKVTCIAIGKFANDHMATTISLDWDPFAECTLSRAEIGLRELRGQLHPEPDQHFKDNVWGYFKNN